MHKVKELMLENNALIMDDAAQKLYVLINIIMNNM